MHFSQIGMNGLGPYGLGHGLAPPAMEVADLSFNWLSPWNLKRSLLSCGGQWDLTDIARRSDMITYVV